MDILNLLSLSGGGLTAFVLFGALGAALMVFIAGAALALRANRAAEESRLALADAEAKMKSAASLADEVRALRAEVERSMALHEEALANARLRQNDPPGQQYAAPAEPAPAPAFEARENRGLGEREDDGAGRWGKRALADDRDDGDVRRGFFSWLFDR